MPIKKRCPDPRNTQAPGIYGLPLSGKSKGGMRLGPAELKDRERPGRTAAAGRRAPGASYCQPRPPSFFLMMLSSSSISNPDDSRCSTTRFAELLARVVGDVLLEGAGAADPYD
jgi:hypothetical protein